MPPHDDIIDALAATALPIHGTTTTYDTGGIVYDTMVAPRTITDPLYRTYTTTDHITIDATPWTIPKFVTEEDLEKAVKKIYNIITDHTTLDISEEEFMSMLKDDNNE